MSRIVVFTVLFLLISQALAWLKLYVTIKTKLSWVECMCSVLCVECQIFLRLYITRVTLRFACLNGSLILTSLNCWKVSPGQLTSLFCTVIVVKLLTPLWLLGGGGYTQGEKSCCHTCHWSKMYQMKMLMSGKTLFMNPTHPVSWFLENHSKACFVGLQIIRVQSPEGMKKISATKRETAAAFLKKVMGKLNIHNTVK